MAYGLRALEEARNWQDWQTLDFPVLGASNFIVPRSFRLGATAQDAMVLRELAKADIAIATSPLDISHAASDYLHALPENCFNEVWDRKTESRRRFGMGLDTYRGGDRQVWSMPEGATGPINDFAEQCATRLNTMMPAGNGRVSFADDFSRGLCNLADAFGIPKRVSLSASPGWMPAPARLQPHHDFGSGSVRIFFNLCGTGTLVADPECIPAEKQEMRETFRDYASRYPTFTELAAQQKGHVFYLPAPTISAWRIGDLKNPAPGMYTSVPHAFPPHKGSVRLTGYANYSYDVLEQHTGLRWRPAPAA